MKKPILEWLNQLPEPYKTKAVSQCRSIELCSSLKDAVSLFREWMDTEEGYSYWNEFYTELKKAERPKSLVEQLGQVGKLWPRNMRDTRLWVEARQWTFEKEGVIGYGDTPLQAIQDFVLIVVKRWTEGGSDASVWNPVIEFLKKEIES